MKTVVLLLLKIKQHLGVCPYAKKKTVGMVGESFIPKYDKPLGAMGKSFGGQGLGFGPERKRNPNASSSMSNETTKG